MSCKRACDPELHLNIADLSNKITIQRRTRVSDGAGGWTETWSTIAAVWASIEPRAAYERFVDGQMQTIARTIMRMRYLKGLTAADRIVHGTTIYNVREVIDVKKRRAVHRLVCDAGASNG